MDAGKVLGYHVIPKEDNSLVNDQELAVQENLTIARVSIQKYTEVTECLRKKRRTSTKNPYHMPRTLPHNSHEFAH